MSSFSSDVITNAAATIVIFALGWIGRTPIMLLVGSPRRRRQFRFFGITQNHTHQIIYVSTLFVPQFGALGFDGKKRSFAGPAVPEYELDAVEVFHELWRNQTLDSLASPVRTRLERFWRLRRVIPEVRTSPRDPAEIERGGSIVCVGSQFFNSVTARYFEVNSPPLVIRDDGFAIVHKGADGLEEWQTHGNPPTDFAIVERILIRETETTVFIVAGLGSVGTTGAMTYLANEWQSLYKAFGDRPFAVCLRFDDVFKDPDAHLRPDVMLMTS